MAGTGNRLHQSTMQVSGRDIRDAEDGVRSIALQADSIMEDIARIWTDDNGKEFVNRYQDVKDAIQTFYQKSDRLARLLEAVLSAYRENVYDPTRKAVFSQTYEKN